jgi:NDP-sugar pyrophosphorylase family protein
MKSTSRNTKKQAMILAAGLGTRLRPLTNSLPKALVRISGTTLLERAISHLAENGVDEIVINVHHFAGMIRNFLKEHDDFGLQIRISDESGELLDTGGGSKKASSLFDPGRPLIIRNVDILSDMDLTALVSYHEKENALATLAVRERETSRYLVFDKTRQLVGWTNVASGELRMVRDAGEAAQKLAFSGIQVLNPKIFGLITEAGKFSLTEMYLRLAQTQKIIAYIDNDSKWKDIGKSVKDLNEE